MRYSQVTESLNHHFHRQGDLIAQYCPDVHPDNMRFIRERLGHFPKELQKPLLKQYRKFDAVRDANIYLRKTTEKLLKTLPKGLLNNFDISEQELRVKAERYAYRSCELKKDVLQFFSDLEQGDVELKIYQRLAEYVSEKGLNAPELTTRMGIDGCIKRLCSDNWWLKKLRKHHKQAIESACLKLNMVNKYQGIYVSDITVKNRLHQKEFQERLLNAICVTNDVGDSYTLKELSDKNISNPAIRKAELMVRMRGFEDLSKQLTHKAIFTTITCPSKYHASLSKSGKPNPKYQDLTPYQAQQYLNNVWQCIRAELDRRQIRVYGMRVAEPQHDGTPHWHLLLFMPNDDVKAFKSVVRHYSLKEDGNEQGAAQNRCDFKEIDPNRGSATGYIAKYIAKNVDGEGLDEGVYGENPIQAAQRVEAWASCWSIRQFQQIGGVSVTVWRELRRLKEQSEDNQELELIRQAADQSDWATYTQLMGGVFCKRKDQIVRPWFDCSVDKDTGEVKTSWLDKTILMKLKGISYSGRKIITRFYNWTMELKQELLIQKADSFEGRRPSLDLCK